MSCIAGMAMLLAACTFDTSGIGTGATGADAGSAALIDASRATADARPTGSIDARTTQSPDADIAPAGTWQNILRNSNFEAADQYWTEHNSSGYQIIADAERYGPARTGDWAAWFGGLNDEHAALAQDIMVPAGATRLRVRGWIYISTEIAGDSDTIDFRLEPAGPTASGAPESLVTFQGTDAGPTGVSDWKQFEADASDVQPGQRLLFVVKSDLNGYDSAMFIVDDLVLEAFIR